jgi:transcriptional regulator with XRE-family HTH domain
MPWPPAPIAISDLCNRLLESLKMSVASGSLTVRRLAKEIGVSQPHMQNIMNGKRALTIAMADRLLEFQRRSVLDLATASELGEALRLASDNAGNSGIVRHVPILPGLLGPGHPFPELGRDAVWTALPVKAVAHIARPVFAELGSDAELARVFPGVSFALLDVSSEVRAEIAHDRWYAIKWSGGGWIRRLRLERGRLLILQQEGLRRSLGPDSIDVGTSRIEEHVRAMIVWMGDDPRRANPLRNSGYLIPPPAEDS